MSDRYNLEIELETNNNIKLKELIDVNIIKNIDNRYILQGDPEGLVEIDYYGKSIAVKLTDIKDMI
jgi:hypothetical protein